MGPGFPHGPSPWAEGPRECGCFCNTTSVDPRLGREGLDLVRQREEVHRAGTEPHLAVAIEPGKRVLEPVLVVALGEILARMGAAALGPVLGRMQRDGRLLQQVF